ncbi:MAG: outer membrane protein assembly factor BamD [Zetaproteobacteria bacterium]|nr:MAG: outer membrane protein assembly factor BamD [Zetaproteobacteria bacterium]
MPPSPAPAGAGIRRLRRATALLLLLLFSGCSLFAEKKVDPWIRDKDMVLAAIKKGGQERDALGRMIQELTRQIVRLQQSDKKQAAQLTAMEAELQALREKQGKLLAERKKRRAKQQAKGAAGHAAPRRGLKRRIAALERDLDRTLKQAAVAGPDQAPPPTPKPTAPPAKPFDPAAEKNSYSAAYLSLKSGRFEEASKQFLAHLKRFPHGNLTDQALYWLGESFLAQQRQKEALKAMKQLVRDYPRSGKYGAALLRIASIYRRQGRVGDAKAAYLQLIQTQPNSPAAERARKQLAELK